MITPLTALTNVIDRLAVIGEADYPTSDLINARVRELRDVANVLAVPSTPKPLDAYENALNIPFQTKPKVVTWHIGDHLTEAQAMELTNTRGYEVSTVARKVS